MKEKIIAYAKEIGFDLVAFSKAKIEEKYLKAFDDWIENNREADMAYMRKIEQRRNLNKILPGAKSVIVLAMNYYYEQKELANGSGRVARYAYGRDYHKIIKKKLKQLQKFLKEIAPSEESKIYVDTGPVLERALAEQSGIGTVGKNSCIISKEFGSWIFLSEIITTLDLPSDEEKKSKFHSRDFSVCGNCTKCIDACPTGAIIAPGVIDSKLCISYLTIENKDKIPEDLAKIISETKRIYGCDICQEVCPHNEAKQKINTHPEFNNFKIAGDQLNKKEVLNIKSADGYLEIFAGSPLMRVKKEGLQRNLKLID